MKFSNSFPGFIDEHSSSVCLQHTSFPLVGNQDIYLFPVVCHHISSPEILNGSSWQCFWDHTCKFSQFSGNNFPELGDLNLFKTVRCSLIISSSNLGTYFPLNHVCSSLFNLKIIFLDRENRHKLGDESFFFLAIICLHNKMKFKHWATFTLFPFHCKIAWKVFFPSGLWLFYTFKRSLKFSFFGEIFYLYFFLLFSFLVMCPSLSLLYVFFLNMNPTKFS